MPATLFTDLLKRGPSVKSFRYGDVELRDWFRDKALQVVDGTVEPDEIVDRDTTRKTVAKPRVGRMLMYRYDPKWKDKLPYYDIFPVIFPIQLYGDRFLGINLHYLPPVYRARLMDALYDVLNNDKYNATTKLKLSYSVLQSASKFRYFKPCVKMYLYSHVRSRFTEIHVKEWDYVMMLPLARFKKATDRSVWDQSLKKIMG